VTGFAQFLGSVRRDPAEGHTLDEVLAAPARRSWWDAAGEAEPADPDECAANLLARGYTPGATAGLALRLQDVEAQVAAEWQKIEASQKAQQRIMRAHQNGQIHAWDIPALLPQDEGDVHRARQLERQAARIRQQMLDAAEMITPAPRLEDPLESASRRAHEAFAESVRSAIAAAQEGRPAPRERRPFPGSGEHTGPDCAVCATAGPSRTAGDVALGYGEISRSAGVVTLPAGQCSYVHEPGRRDGSPHSGPCQPRQRA
jgi:hypothetical protein